MMMKLNLTQNKCSTGTPYTASFKSFTRCSIFNIDAIVREVNNSGAWMTCQVILVKLFHTPFERHHCLKGMFDDLYDLINKRGGVTTLFEE